MIKSHISSIGLQNFRAIKDKAVFQFAPITIEVGSNNSAKSTVVKALLLLKNNFEKSNIPTRLDMRESEYGSHFLGAFKNITNKSSKSSAIHFSFGIQIEYKCGEKTGVNLELVYDNEKAELSQINLKSSANRKYAVNATYQEKEAQYSCQINTNEILKLLPFQLKEYVIKPSYSDKVSNFSPYEGSVEDLISKIEGDTPWNWEYVLSHIPSNIRKSIDIKNPESLVGVMSKIPLTNRIQILRKLHLSNSTSEIHLNSEQDQYHDETTVKSLKKLLDEPLIAQISSTEVDGRSLFNIKDKSKLNRFEEYSEHFLGDSLAVTNYVESIFELINVCFDTVCGIFRGQNINFIPPVRAVVERSYKNSYRATTNFGSLLEDFADVYVENENEPWSLFVNQWLDNFGVGEKIFIERGEDARLVYIQKGKDKTLLADMGYGITQFLPILFRIAIQASKNIKKNDSHFSYYSPSILIIEEPELSLHPNLQSKIADVLIDANNRFNLQFIVETHSEYLVRKFQYWMAKKVITPPDVNIYYFNFNNEEDKENVWKITIKENGKLSKRFGSGFYDESTKAFRLLLKSKNKSL